MDLLFDCPNEWSLEQDGDFSILVLCGNAAATDRAGEVLQFLLRQLKCETGRLFCQWWNFEFLAVRELWGKFAAHTASADLIIISVHNWSAPPEPLAAWLRQLPELRKGRLGALIAVLDPALNKWDAEPEMLSQLKQAASSSCLDFFATHATTGLDLEAVRDLSRPTPPPLTKPANPVFKSDHSAQRAQQNDPESSRNEFRRRFEASSETSEPLSGLNEDPD